MFQVKNELVFFLADGQETVAWVFLDNAVFWKIRWLTFFVLLYLCEEVDGLRLATTKRYVGFVQVVGNTLRVCVLVSHKFLYLL